MPHKQQAHGQKQSQEVESAAAAREAEDFLGAANAARMSTPQGCRLSYPVFACPSSGPFIAIHKLLAKLQERILCFNTLSKLWPRESGSKIAAAQQLHQHSDSHVSFKHVNYDAYIDKYAEIYRGLYANCRPSWAS